ncbi:TPA: EpsG family protein [Pseudomonas putida]|uniref:EpsG family protein n=1 Tax=Pseudomonas putida TaxID=303 RepID=UPI00110C9C36|nr:EpsG family protein [Pseudomonas putida]MDD1993791.1 EpsG family protein [Pseudomonas putida]HDS0916914.1 EpsG family protein [Pseudomonas putida]HDS0932555.1 EpsG family protein [Pseudomonas putida]HDS1782125.1 EpsG family protein [Pseudomonas putida]HDS3797935.1 EpsG family protein [Pseudomonas putida]
MIYIFGWAMMLLALFASEITMNRSRIPVALVILFVAAVAVLRGAVGTDTSTYEWLLDSSVSDVFAGGIEPVFTFLGWLFMGVTGSSIGAVRLFGLLLFVILFYYLLRSNANERFFLLSCFLPSFIYQYSMNTLRLGLASVFLLLAFQYVRHAHYSKRAGFSFVALGFHYSSIFNVAYLMMLRMPWARWSSVIAGVGFAVSVGLILILKSDYFLMKLSAYSAVSSPGKFSGLSKVAIIAVMLMAVSVSRMPRGDKMKLIMLTTGLAVAFFALASISYAGLRFLDLLCFSLPLAVLVAYNDNECAFDWVIKIGLSAVGVLSMVASYRNYLQEMGQGPSPFLPYHLLDALGGL